MPYSLLAKGDVPNITTIEEGTDDQVEAHGYCESPCRKFLYNIGIFITCGFLLLFSKWFPQWKVWITCRPCSVSIATVLILKVSISIGIFMLHFVEIVYSQLFGYLFI